MKPLANNYKSSIISPMTSEAPKPPTIQEVRKREAENKVIREVFGRLNLPIPPSALPSPQYPQPKQEKYLRKSE